MTNLHIYQSFHDEEGKNNLDSEFIPFDNMNNLTPHLREYPMLKKLFHKHRDTDAYWGMVSWRWRQKTQLNPQEFIDWINDNPGYDVYHIDPNLEVMAQYPNLWVQGERWHPGMLRFGNKLLPKLGIDIKLEEYMYRAEDFATTSFYVGNDKFWKEWYLFLDYALALCGQDEELHSYLYKEGQLYNGHWVPYFIFAVERLQSIFYIYNRNIRVKKFPVDNECYTRLFGSLHPELLRIYTERNR